MGIIKCNPAAGIQNALDELISNTPEFSEILDAEVERLGLVDIDVRRCLRFAYHETAKIAHGNSGMLTIYREDHKDCEIAALSIYLKIQQQWKNPLSWREVEGRKGAE